jgi:hypothetical protein
MLRFATGCFFAGILWASCNEAQAQWMTNFWDGRHVEYKRNNDWPQPFIQADREAALLPFSIMEANGWRRANLLSDYHFREDSNQLNQAGELKLRYILTQMPPQRRTVFVPRGLTPEVTAARIEKAHRSAARMLGSGLYPEIVESDLPNDGWPADEIDSITKGFNSSRPQPRVTSSGGGGGGSGSPSGSTGR